MGAPGGHHLKLIRAELQKCVKCGECRSVCPIFSVKQREPAVARGKLALIEAAAEGDLAPGPEFHDIVNDCLLCLACVEHCGGGVRVDRIVTAARAELAEACGRPWLQRLLRRVMTANRRLIRRLLPGGSRMQAVLFSRIPETSGMRRRFPLPLVDRSRFVPTLAGHPFRERVAETLSAQRPRATVVFFTGCLTNYSYTSLAQAVVDVLNRLGVSVIIPKGQVCCGAPIEAGGDFDLARRLARRNLRELKRFDPACKVVVCCASGGRMLKRVYPRLLAEDRRWRAAAEELASRTLDIAEYLTQQIGIPALESRIRQPSPVRTTYHDPCHLNRGQGVRAAPRALLSLACGDNFVEMPDAHTCCGSGGTYGVTHRDTANRILASKVDGIVASGAGQVATGCPGCMVQLQDGVLQKGLKTRICHTIEILARAMEGETRVDTTAKKI